MNARAALTDRVQTIPREPGCYLWKDREGNVLYVGKAQDLRARVTSYLHASPLGRTGRMMALAADLEFVATRTEPEALILEQTLIKRHRPPYNVMLTDDKKYPYIAVTAEQYPRVVYTRELSRGGTIFGPFPDAGYAKHVARLVNKTFQLRQCRVLPRRECLYYHLGQCTAPCIGAVTGEQYRVQAERAQEFLRGGGRELAKELRARMEEASGDLKFEEAARLRDTAASIDSVLQRQYAETPGGEDADAIGLARRDDRACAVVLFVRGGAVVGSEHYFLSHAEEVPEGEVVRAFLEQYYAAALRPPRRVLLPVPIEDAAGLAAAIGRGGAARLEILVPERGGGRARVEIAEKNATLLLEQEFLVRERKGSGGLEALRAALDLTEPPGSIEAFDVSHHKGEHTVASLVVLKDGEPHKAAYRRFRIRTASGGDDPGAMREVVRRRYERVLAEDGADALPDLILVDGGRTQLEAALGSLKELGLDKLPVVGLAKKLEEVYRPHRLQPLVLPKHSPALHLLQKIRDEAHRFAIRYQDVLTRRALLASELDEIEGVGPERKRRLLRTFGSLDGLSRASAEEIAKVPGVTKPLAEKIVASLKRPSGPNRA